VSTKPTNSVFWVAMRPERPLYLSAPLWRQQFLPLNKVAYNLEQPAGDVLTAAALAYLATFPDGYTLVQAMTDALDRYGRKGYPPKLHGRFDWPEYPRALKSLNSSQL